MSPRAWKYRRRCRCVLERCHLQSPCLNKNSVQNARACIPPWRVTRDSASPYLFLTPSNHWHANSSENALYLCSWTCSKDLLRSYDQEKTFTHGTNNMASWLTTTKNRAADRCTHEWSHQGGARSPSPLQGRHVAHLHRPIPMDQWVDTWKTMGKPEENHGKLTWECWFRWNPNKSQCFPLQIITLIWEKLDLLQLS